MYTGKKISVAIATYNGEKYLEEQLDSILKQTVPPDEIVISDDGSNDRTLEIAKKISSKVCGLGTEIAIITDNPRHGIGGNFEWAITHATGDYIFICGQDDIWLPEKVEHVIKAFIAHPDAKMICHDLSLIDKNDKYITDRCVNFCLSELSSTKDELIKVNRQIFLERAVSSVLISGPAMCIDSELAKTCMPIAMDCAEDQWLQFCAVADDGLYYLNEILTKYRVHDSTSHSLGMGVVARIRKIIGRIKSASKHKKDLVNFAAAVVKKISENDESQAAKAALGTAKRIMEIGSMEIEAASSGRITGAIKLVKMFCTDIRYRRIGTAYFLTNLLNLLFVGKIKRINDMNN